MSTNQTGITAADRVAERRAQLAAAKANVSPNREIEFAKVLGRQMLRGKLAPGIPHRTYGSAMIPPVAIGFNDIARIEAEVRHTTPRLYCAYEFRAARIVLRWRRRHEAPVRTGIRLAAVDGRAL